MNRRKICISIAAPVLSALLIFSGCGTKEVSFRQPYDIAETAVTYPETASQSGHTPEPTAYFASGLCVETQAQSDTDTAAAAAEAAGVFHEGSHTVTYARNIYEKLYPASTTKILTAYIALKYGTLSDKITVSANAGNQPSDSSVCNIHEGDTLTLEQLLHGLLMVSGNDAAVAIAEYISGSTEAFAALMNQEAAALGATNSHFVNPHGLTDVEHYTCVYDLYLIFHAALQNEEFKKIIHTKQYTADYQDKNGARTVQEWATTNKFLLGEADAPKGVTVIGGKTGTTEAAGYCLVLYSCEDTGEPVISIVLRADSRDSLYRFMAELLDRY